MADAFGDESTDRSIRNGASLIDTRSLAGRKRRLQAAFETSYANDKDEKAKIVTSHHKPSLYRRAKIYQFKALVIKEMRLHSKQIFSNLCQIMTPVLILVLLYILMNKAEDLISLTDVDFHKRPMIPIVFNLPLALIKNNAFYPISTDTCMKWFAYDFDSSLMTPKSLSVVDKITNDPLAEYCSEVSKSTPFFKRAGDKGIVADLAAGIAELNKQPYNYGTPTAGMEKIPDGAIYFKNIDADLFDIRLMINDMRLMEYHLNNGLTKQSFKLNELLIKKMDDELGGIRNRLKNQNASFPFLTISEGLMGLMDIVTRNVVHHVNPKVHVVSAYTYIMRSDLGKTVFDSVSILVCASLCPVAMGLVLPLFMYSAVLERENRIKGIMKAHGLTEIIYWLAITFTNFLLFLIIYLVFSLTGQYAFEIPFFKKTSPWVLFIINALWGLNQIGLAIILQTALNSSRAANILGYVVSMSMQFICIAVSFQMYLSPFEVPITGLMLPHMAYTRIYYHLSMQCMETRCPQSMADLKPAITRIISCMTFTAAFYLCAGILLNVWLNGESEELFAFLYCRRPATQVSDTESTTETDIGGQLADEPDPQAYSVFADGLSKTYYRGSTPFHALKSVALRLKRGQVLGLLGPNGAGKTTLLSILTGATQPDSGQAYVGGFNVATQLPEVYKRIGVCPQFDLLWQDLTGFEHLVFYARLKGLDSEGDIDDIVWHTVRQVKMEKHVHKQSRLLSGGQRRRLSLAIALIGNPSVVFLDEPTTGLDPMNREALWQIVEANKATTSFIITTHLMQEADYLSDIIAVMSHGQILAQGTSTDLKKKHGAGLLLTVLFGNSSRLNSNVELLYKKMRDFRKDNILDSFETFTTSPDNRLHKFTISAADTKLAILFTSLQGLKVDCDVNHIELSQSPLKEVFERLVLHDSQKVN